MYQNQDTCIWNCCYGSRIEGTVNSLPSFLNYSPGHNVLVVTTMFGNIMYSCIPFFLIKNIVTNLKLIELTNK